MFPFGIGRGILLFNFEVGRLHGIFYIGNIEQRDFETKLSAIFVGLTTKTNNSGLIIRMEIS